jgi:hypothetical protein
MYLGNIKHTDGWWYTHQYEYKNRKILIKLRKSHNIKVHVFYPDSNKVAWTRRYNFFNPDKLFEKVKNLIDIKEK